MQYLRMEGHSRKQRNQGQVTNLCRSTYSFASHLYLSLFNNECWTDNLPTKRLAHTQDDLNISINSIVRDYLAPVSLNFAEDQISNRCSQYM